MTPRRVDQSTSLALLTGQNGHNPSRSMVCSIFLHILALHGCHIPQSLHRARGQELRLKRRQAVAMAKSERPCLIEKPPSLVNKNATDLTAHTNHTLSQMPPSSKSTTPMSMSVGNSVSEVISTSACERNPSRVSQCDVGSTSRERPLRLWTAEDPKRVSSRGFITKTCESLLLKGQQAWVVPRFLSNWRPNGWCSLMFVYLYTRYTHVAAAARNSGSAPSWIASSRARAVIVAHAA